MQTATDDLLVGRTLEGRYRVIDRLARGGMSTVYSARDERLDRLVAVKVMSAALSADPAFNDRFTREARAAARLTHLNTVAVYDQGVQDSPDGRHVFLVMELVRGRTLRDLMRERGAPFSPAEALSIMQPVLAALSAAHAAGLVHRDVKPENILVSDDGLVKVADFGLARAVESDAASTRTGLMMGTVAYCSPEQITGGQADKRSDVYAAGIVLFELLTGRPPYAGDSPITVAYQHVNSRVPAPSSRVRGVPSEVDELVVFATDPDPEQRPVDAGEFLAEIADVRERLRLPATPIPTRQRVWTPEPLPAAPPLAVSPQAASTDVLGYGGGRHDTRVVDGVDGRGGGVAAPPAPPRTRRPRRQRTARERRRRRGLIALLVVVLLGIGIACGGWWFASGRYARVPDLVGSSASQARQAIHDTGFSYGGVASREHSETMPAGQVIKTEPTAGAREKHNATISLVLSLGPQLIKVPDVVKQPLSKAQQAILAQHLTLNPQVQQKYSSTVTNGKVISSDPPAGRSIRKTTPVTLTVSLGPPKVAVPTIKPGTPYDEAAKTLRDAHFKPVRGADQYSDDVDSGGVISISPTGKQTEFSQITVTVSKGPRMVAVPDIKRFERVSDAVAALSAVGLDPRVNAIGGGDGTWVLKISPSSGTEVAVGSPVTITAF